MRIDVPIYRAYAEERSVVKSVITQWSAMDGGPCIDPPLFPFVVEPGPYDWRSYSTKKLGNRYFGIGSFWFPFAGEPGPCNWPVYSTKKLNNHYLCIEEFPAIFVVKTRTLQEYSLLCSVPLNQMNQLIHLVLTVEVPGTDFS